MTSQVEITLPAFPRGYHLISDLVFSQLELPEQGLLNVFIQHTSAALCLNESADPDVRHDLEKDLDRLVPPNNSYYLHRMEGEDDMPAHTKAALLGCSINLPISNGRIALGTWQGLWLCEFRNYGGPRKLVCTVVS